LDDAVLHFVWTLVRLEGCPMRLAPAASIALRPCAYVEGGILTTERERSLESNDDRRAWFDVGASARATWAFGKPIAYSRFDSWPEIELEVGAAVPFQRDTILFPANAGAYRASSVNAFASVVAGVRFW